MDLGFKGGFSFFGREYAPHPFEIVWANEINEHACRTYRQNLGQKVHLGDIWKKMDGQPKSADVVIGRVSLPGYFRKWKRGGDKRRTQRFVPGNG